MPVLYESTYKWTCNACYTEVLAIRKNEQVPAVSIGCPFCGFRILVTPTIRREQRKDLVPAAEVKTA